MAEPSMANIPPGFQVHVQKLNQRVTKLENANESLRQRLAAIEAELQRRKGGRPMHKRDAA